MARPACIFNALVVVLWGPQAPKSTFTLSTALFLRGLALIHLIAFASAYVQIDVLVGEKGVLPLAQTMELLRAHFNGPDFLQYPTLFWWSYSDTALHALCVAGMVSAVIAFIGWAPHLCFAALYVLYLSLVHAGNIFYHFQWDILLLEVTFAAVFLVPWRLQVLPAAAMPNPIFRWVLWFTLFRLMWGSGVVKRGDPTWLNWDALRYHFETQPLPTVLGWYAHHLPPTLLQWSVGAMFFIELAAPWGIMLPRNIRHLTALSFILLMVLIMLTGNYTYFNWLTILLSLLLVDDDAWPRCLRRLARRSGGWSLPPRKRGYMWLGYALRAAVATILFFLGTVQCVTLFRAYPSLPRWMARPLQFFSPFYLANRYGLFAVMTTRRNEIVIEGSDDGVTWKEYEFPYKPGDLSRRPMYVAPHQPRLDWQMWFAALGSFQQNPWVNALLLRLLEGSPTVGRWFSVNPFPDKPPRFIRASLYEYHFTSLSERKETGRWWRREYIGIYHPPMYLRRPPQNAAEGSH